MKHQGIVTLAALVIALAGAALWIFTPEPVAPAAAAPGPDALARMPVSVRTAEGPAAAENAPDPQQRPAPTVRTELPGSDRESSGESPGWSVIVLDASRRPIEGACVDLVEIATTSDGRRTKTRAQTYGSRLSDENGMVRFSQPPNPERFGVVARARGWLRSAVAPPLALVVDPSAPQVVTMQRGGKLRGRVVDLQGQPVPGLDLLAVTEGYNVDHVSLSSVTLRARDRNGDPRNRRYQQANATTGTDGTVTFEDVPPEAEMIVRSDDPGWRIVSYRTESGNSPFVTWTAAPAAGVVIRVLDATTRQPVLCSARFRVDLELGDGTVREEGQWVGKGDGSLRFSFHEELLPGLEDLDVLRATFHGTATTAAGTESWRSTPIVNPMRGGVAELEILVSARASEDGGTLDANPTLRLELDVVDAAGRPYSGPLNVGWSSETRAGYPRGEEPAEQVRAGTFRAGVRLPSDIEELEIFAQPGDASGSLEPWTVTVKAVPDELQNLSVRLPPAGSVGILRPRGWEGDWTVRASYRQNPGDPWKGSFTYEARAERLTLNALRPAEWRFELEQTEPERSTTLRVPVGVDEERLIGG